MKHNICIYHPHPLTLKAYRQLFDASSGFHCVGEFTDFKSLCICLESKSVSIALVSIEGLNDVDLNRCRIKIRETNARIKIVALGTQRLSAMMEELLALPVRGIVDYVNQSKVQILQCLRHVLNEGSDFSYLKQLHPSQEAKIVAYEEGIPNVDERFWELLPMLATNASKAEIATYFKITPKTLRLWTGHYCETFGVTGLNELIVMAANNRCIDNDQIHLARNRISNKN